MPLTMNINNNSIFVEGAAPERGANIPQAMTSALPLALSRHWEGMLEGRDFIEEDGDAKQREAS